MSSAQLSSVLELVAASTRDRGRHAFLWNGDDTTTISYHGFDNLIAGLLLPTGSTGKLFAPAPWERADRHCAASAADRSRQRFQANARARAREALAAACSALAREAWSDSELLLALSRKLESRNTSLVDAFRKADADGSGLVNAAELSAAMAGLDLGITHERAAALVKAFDRTGNGKVACFEFIRMVNSGFSDGASASASAGAGAGAGGESKGGRVYTPRSEGKEEFKEDDVRSALSAGGAITEASLATDDRETLLAFRSKMEDDRLKMRQIFQQFDKSGSKTVSPKELRQGLASLGIELDDGQAKRLTARFDLAGDGRLHYYEFVKMFHGLPPSSAY